MTLNVDLLKASGRVFDGQPDPSQYFATPAMDAVRQRLLAQLQPPRGVVALTGPSGAGKTLMVRSVLAALPGHWAHVAHLAYTSMSGSEILQSVAYGFGMPREQARGVPSLIRWLEAALDRWAVAGETSLLVIDEAHHLPMAALRPLLALAVAPPGKPPRLCLLLAGHPALAELLADALPPTADGSLAAEAPLQMPRFEAAESAAFIAGRMARLQDAGAPLFQPAVVAEIHRCAQGRPGRVNALCQQLVHNAAMNEAAQPVTAASVQAMAAELGYAVPVGDGPGLATAGWVAPEGGLAAESGAEPAPPRRRWGWIALVVAALAAAALLALAQLSPRARPAETAAPPLGHMAPPPASPTPTPSGPAMPAVPAEPPASSPPAASASVESPSASPAAVPATSVGGIPAAAAPTTGPVDAPARHTTVAKPATGKAAPVPARGTTADCARLLSQLSLGEPLTARQQNTFRSHCR